MSRRRHRRPGRRPGGTAAAVLLLAASLGGCGGGGTDTYCDTLAAQVEELQRLSDEAADRGSGLMVETLDVFEALRADAPADIADEWDTVVFAWQGLTEAVDAAGLDLARFEAGAPRPPGTTPAELRAVTEAAEDLRSPRVREAVGGIEQHARDVCGTDLSDPALGF